MWFKNLLIYRLNPGWQMAPGALEELLAQRPLMPCTGLNLKTRGWVSPRNNGQLVYGQNRHLLIAFGQEEKILPGSVVKQMTEERAAQLEKLKGFKPGRKAVRDLKDQVVAELLPRAFARRRSVRAWLDPQAGWLLIDAATPARGEALLELLRETLGEAPWAPLEAERSAGDLMTQWLAGGHAPNPFMLGDECELAGVESAFKDGKPGEKSVVKYLRYPIEGEDVRQHLRAGKRATRLKLQWHDRLAFVLHENVSLKRLSFLLIDQAREAPQQQDPDEQFDAEFALMAGEVGHMLEDLTAALGLRVPVAAAA